MSVKELPIPDHFQIDRVGEVWRVPYQERARDAKRWAKDFGIKPTSKDKFRVSLVLIDVQNTFCVPEFELFVAGRSGIGAVSDNKRLCEFIYRNLNRISAICPTMDTHQAMQIFHSIFLINEQGEHPAPFSLIPVEDVQQGVWKFNPEVGETLGIDEKYGQQYLLHYTKQLKAGDKYELTIWPYHAMLGGIGHALVSAVEEAIFFHGIARLTQAKLEVKGNNPLTENYSVLSPEVLEDFKGKSIEQKNSRLIKRLIDFDVVIIAGQAKSHCVAWTIADLLTELKSLDPKLSDKVYLLEDCTSSVVIPGVIDYTDDADAAFQRFADAGMHIVKSTDPITSWRGISD